MNGVFPDKYSFYNKPGRSFRTEFASNDKEFSIVLYERTDKQGHEECFARGLFTNLDNLSSVIDLWVDKRKGINEIKHAYAELELFEDFNFRNPDNEIDKAWSKVKNMFFNNTLYWKYPEWNERYSIMLIAAKKHKAFENYFPFTSMDWLRFSIDKDIKEAWTFDKFIVPTIYSDELPATVGKFYVSYNDKPMGGKFFEEIENALDFYAEILKEAKPIKLN